MTDAAGKMSLQSWMIAPETVRVMDALHANGGQARFVGGCVRNALANRKVIDIDIATPLTPEEVIGRLDAAKIHHVPTGLLHGTVTAVVDGAPFEITTLRQDIRGHGRHADVLFTDDWKTDASRRDFTINAVYMTRDGTLFDYFGGIEDLRKGRVVFIGDAEQRIREDVLRILRFFRFFAHFGQGAADATALSACARLANLIPNLSGERLRQETLKILDSDRSAEVWGLMMQDGVTTYYLPEAMDLKALERLITLEHRFDRETLPLRRLASLLQATDDGLRQVAKTLRLSNDEGGYLSRLYHVQEDISAGMTEQELRRQVYYHGNDIVRSALLLSAARKGGAVDIERLYNMATSFRPPRLPVTGQDVLLTAVAAGPGVGRVLKVVEDWWLAEDMQPGRTACLEKLRQAAEAEKAEEKD